MCRVALEWSPILVSSNAQHLPLRPWGTGAKDQVVAIVMETVSGRRIPDVREVTTED